MDSFLSDDVPPMGIYETLYAFHDSFGSFMGTPGTHPWSQGFPLTTQLEDGYVNLKKTQERRLNLYFMQARASDKCRGHMGRSLLSQGMGPSIVA